VFFDFFALAAMTATCLEAATSIRSKVAPPNTQHAKRRVELPSRNGYLVHLKGTSQATRRIQA
jgi:hypothetical protein